MKKYMIKLHGSVVLGQWHCELSCFNMNDLADWCERQLEYFPNVNEMQVFESEGDMKYLGSYNRKTYAEWKGAK